MMFSSSKPAAAGLRTSGPLGSSSGPSPIKSVPLDTVIVSEPEKSTVPMIVAKSPMANSASIVPKNSNVPLAMLSVKVVPLSSTVGTAAGSITRPVFTCTPTEPPMATPSVSTDARPETTPTSASEVTRKAPDPPWMPWPPKVTKRLSTASTVLLSAPCWKRKSPARATTPADVSSVAVVPSTSMRANGPPGSCRVMSPAVTSTAVAAVLKATRPVPARERSSILVARVPAAVPASPALSSTNVPEPLAILTKSMDSLSVGSAGMASDTSLALMSSTSSPEAFSPRRITRSALMSGPSRAMATLSAVTRT